MIRLLNENFIDIHMPHNKHIGRKMEHLGRTNTHHMYTHSVKRWVHLDRVEAERWSILAGQTHHMYTHSVKRWVHLDRVQAERWSILAGQTHTRCTHILSKDGCILTESWPKDGASWPDKHTPHVHTFCQKMEHLDRVQAERWSILAGHTHTTCTHILSKDGSILTGSRLKDGASWLDKHTQHVHTFCQKMGAS